MFGFIASIELLTLIITNGIEKAICDQANMLSEKYDVEMPIVSMVNAIVNDEVDASNAVSLLMNRDKKKEM